MTTAVGISTITGGDEFTYDDTDPTVSAVSPNAGPTGGGTTVTLTGTNFYGTIG